MLRVRPRPLTLLRVVRQDGTTVTDCTVEAYGIGELLRIGEPRSGVLTVAGLSGRTAIRVRTQNPRLARSVGSSSALTRPARIVSRSRTPST